MYGFLIDVVCLIAVSGSFVLLVQWLHVEDGLHILFAVVGSVSFFFGKYLTGSGAFARYHYINAPTPEIVWKLAGVICWITATISFCHHLP